MLFYIKKLSQVYMKDIASFLNFKTKASITIETALSLSIAIFVLIFMLGPIFIINSTADILVKIDENSRMLCYYDLISENYVRDNTNFEHLNIDLLNDTYFEFLNKINIPATLIGTIGAFYRINNENIILNSSGDFDSILYDNNHMINYDINFYGKHPLNIWNLKNPEFRLINSRRSFVGTLGNRWDEKNKDSTLVYNVSDDSEVYHLKSTCTYLKKNIENCSKHVIQARRNINGSKYEMCKTCSKGIEISYIETVYYTKYGTNYHFINNCSRLEPLIIREMSLDDAINKGLRVCSKCNSENKSEDLKDN